MYLTKVLKYFIMSLAVMLLMACGNSGSSSSTAGHPAGGEPSSANVVKESAVTIYIHGFSRTGYKANGVYGENGFTDENEELANFVGFSLNYAGANTNFEDNVLVSTSYYGDQFPGYYTEQDIRDIENVTALYGGGIPRYALIVAKYARHIMQESGVKKVNFLSASMGSLVARWMIEKNLENLSSDQKIAKWLSVEGIVAGNYAASDDNLVKFLEIYEEQSPEVEHMSYGWVNANFGNGRVGESSFYKNILLGFESSTNDNALQGMLSKYLIFWDQFYANDGYQLVNDTFFVINNPGNLFRSLPPVRSYFHENHISIRENSAAWMQASLFFISTKRVKMTLTKVTVFDNHEAEALKPAEIVFSSSVASPKFGSIAGIDEEIDRRDINGGALVIYPYSNSGDTKMLNQDLYDGFVRADESTLAVNINAYEIDNSVKYDTNENSADEIVNLGGSTFDIPIQNGVYKVSGMDWDGEVSVQIFAY